MFTSEPDPKYVTKDWRIAKQRVAGYLRVSTDKSDQENSLKNQRSHYEEMIAANPLWDLVGLYQDEGISGTSMHNRKGLLHLIEACKEGLIDLIVVKEVSRLARNTRDCLAIVQQLASLDPPVGIYFENNNLNTLEAGNKIVLTVLAMAAELDSELKSSSVAFGLIEMYRKSNFPAPKMLGYQKIDKYEMGIEPEGARTVRLIYDLFLSGVAPADIACILTDLKRPTAKGKIVWSATGVLGIVGNEKYSGAYLMQKKYTVTFLTHQMRRNVGQKRIYHDPEHHEPIVTPEEHARALIMIHADHSSPYFNNKYEIRMVRRGLLTGFIPINVAFGGYGAEHYLAAYIMARVPLLEFSVDVPIIPGLRRIMRELSCDRFTGTLNITRRRMMFNKTCISQLDAKYVEILLNPKDELLAVRKTTKKNPNAVIWNDIKIPSQGFVSTLFELMDWQQGWQCKMPMNILRRGDQKVLMFDLNNCEYRYREDDKQTKYVRAIPNTWMDVTGIDDLDHYLRTRRAYANHTSDWRIDEPATAVEGFDTYIEPKTNDEINSIIQELIYRDD